MIPKILISECLEEIIKKIDLENKSLSNQELLRLCQPAGDVLKGTINPHFCHEIGETAINHLIRQKYAAELLRKQSSPIEKLNEIIRPLVAKLPTESWRSREQNALQQFSTPPAIAYLLAYLMNLQPGETALEPSAGTGNLAVWTTELRIKTYVNEIDPRRRGLLDILGFQPTGCNAEFINDLLTPEIKADVIMMNPPFSANGERTANNSSKYGFRHVESALERLEKGGKFGIILGEAAELKTKTGNEFWHKMARRIKVKTIIKIAGREYYKNGTSVDVNIIVGTKRREEKTVDWSSERERIVSVSANSVDEAFGFASKLNLRLE